MSWSDEQARRLRTLRAKLKRVNEEIELVTSQLQRQREVLLERIEGLEQLRAVSKLTPKDWARLRECTDGRFILRKEGAWAKRMCDLHLLTCTGGSIYRLTAWGRELVEERGGGS